MNATRNLRPLLFASATALLAIGATLPVHAADCTAPKGLAEERACAAAAQGIEPLRRFVERTRMIHGLRVHDFAKALPPEQLAKEGENVKVAQTK